MRVKILGSAAGGGFPQWNCACANCHRLREGRLNGPARTQAQIAFSPDGDRWYLIGASPDLRLQIQSTPELHPGKAPRHTPIEAVLLAGADLDHVLGLLLLREFQSFQIYASAGVRRVLREENSFFRTLGQQGTRVTWRDVRPGERISELPGVSVEAVALPGNFPAYASEELKRDLAGDEAVMGFRVTAADSGKSFFYAPVFGGASAELMARLGECDLLLVDGTFWREDELIRIRGEGRTSSEMGHMPIAGERGTLKLFAGCERPRKIFVHINNTNPILDEDSPEFAEARAAGWEAGRDGMEFEL
jgi:pyrroloquinoline quinone biosynthesis protein B